MHEVPESSKLFCFADDANLVCQKDSCVQPIQDNLCALRLWSYCISLFFQYSEVWLPTFQQDIHRCLVYRKRQLSWLEHVSDVGVEVSSSHKWGARL